MDLEINQRATELKYSKRNIKAKIEQDILGDDDYLNMIDTCVDAINDWMAQSYYPSKDARIRMLQRRDIRQVIIDILCVTMQITEPKELTSVVGEITGCLGFSNKIDGTKTAAELLAVMAISDAFDIFKEDVNEPMHLVSNYRLMTETLEFIRETKYLPPMVVPPRKVKKNFDYSHLTEKSSMILGKGTYHDGDICLDSINKFNQVPLTLNVRLLTSLSEAPKKQYDPDVQAQWSRFVEESYRTYRDLIQLGNQFWLTHKVDKRGRTYAQGYHVTTQGNQFRKAIVELADKEVIELC